MSPRERTHTRITGHTGGEGGSVSAHSEPGVHPDPGTPGQFEGPLDGRLSGYADDTRMEAGEPTSRRWTTPRAAPRAHPAAGDGRMDAMGSRSGARSMVELLRELSTESGNLVRQEIELAKAEMREKAGVFQRSLVSIGIGAGLLLGALMLALWALNSGLTALLAQGMDLDIAVWLAPLILTVALAAIGWGLIRGASGRMADEGLVPRRTARTLREDERWARAKVHEIKEEVAHGR